MVARYGLWAALGLMVLTAMSVGTARPQGVSAATVTVFMESEQFIPSLIVVPAGTTVVWVNNDGQFHTVTSLDGEDRTSRTFSSPICGPGQSFSFTFHDPGVYRYYSEINPSMKGEVRVEEVIPTRRGQRPPRLDRVAPQSGLSVRELRSALVTADEVGAGLVVTSEDDSDPGVAIARDFERPGTGQPAEGIRISLMADAPYSVDQFFDGVLFGLRYERPNLVVDPLPVPAELGEVARAAIVPVEEDGKPFTLLIIMWQHGSVLAYVFGGIGEMSGIEASISPEDVSRIAVRQHAKLATLLATAEIAQ